MKRWDFSVEGQICPTCDGTGNFYEERDMHRSGGVAPCPRGYFDGHGYPTCQNGKLVFSDYDKQNKKRLMKDFNEEKYDL